MSKTLRSSVLVMMCFWMLSASAQRYLNEVFTDAQINVTSNVIFGINTDFLASDLSTNPPTIVFDTLRMDIYEPMQSADTLNERPLIVYLHTGNALPPPLNGSPNGMKTDSSAVNLCTQWAKRGYVAVAIDLRHGWNPLSPDPQVRLSTLLNAVYRQVHDAKQAVRTLRADAAAGNTYGIDVDKIVMYGEGTGGYVAQAYTTLDDPLELFIVKFRPDPFDPTVSYVDTNIVGNIEGFGGALNFYTDNGFSSEVHMSINAGGALADSSWLEPGDVPMVAFHTIRDDFAPFTLGDVIVPTTQEIVVEVQGSNWFIQQANDYGNNDSFKNLPSDPFTDRARSLYGTSWSASNGNTEVVSATPEGLFPVVRPLRPFLLNEASPWQWWDSLSPLAMAFVDPGPPPVTAHQASLLSNPDMSAMKGRTYLDTIQGYMNPRVVCALNLLPGFDCNAGITNDSPNNESFETGTFPPPCWTLLDEDGDGQNWFRAGAPGFAANTGDSVAVSASWNGTPLTPENYLILPQVTPGPNEHLTYFVAAQDPAYPDENYSIVVSTTGTDAADFSTELFNEVLVDDTWLERTIDLTAYEGMNIYLAFKHFNVTDEFMIKIDDVQWPTETNPCTIGIEENIAQYNLNVFPNPATSEVQFMSDETMISMDIVDIAGRTVRTEEINNTNFVLEREDLVNGVYFVNIQFENGSMTQKLILE